MGVAKQKRDIQGNATQSATTHTIYRWQQGLKNNTKELAEIELPI